MRLLHFLKLIRIGNIAIAALLLIFFKTFIINPVFKSAEISPGLSNTNFVIFVISVCLIAAGGNVINDFFDFELDKKYKTKRQVLGKDIFTLDFATSLTIFLFTSGVLAGFAVSWKTGQFKLSYLFVISAMLLGLYSYLLKSIAIIGNLTIAILCTLPLIILVNLEYTGFNINQVTTYNEKESMVRYAISVQLIGYSCFAFLLTFIRELTKDIEDMEGDKEFNHKTLPIIIGFKYSKIFAATLLTIALSLSVLLQLYFFTFKENPNQFWYIFFTIDFSLVICIFSTFPIKKPDEISFTNLFLKLTILWGILSIPFFYYLNSK